MAVLDVIGSALGLNRQGNVGQTADTGPIFTLAQTSTPAASADQALEEIAKFGGLPPGWTVGERSPAVNGRGSEFQVLDPSGKVVGSLQVSENGEVTGGRIGDRSVTRQPQERGEAGFTFVSKDEGPARDRARELENTLKIRIDPLGIGAMRDVNGDGIINGTDLQEAPTASAEEVGRTLGRRAAEQGIDVLCFGENHDYNNTEPSGPAALAACRELIAAGKTAIFGEELPYDKGQFNDLFEAFNSGKMNADQLEAALRKRFDEVFPNPPPKLTFESMFGNMVQAARLGAKLVNLDEEGYGGGKYQEEGQDNRDAIMEAKGREALARYGGTLVAVGGSFHMDKEGVQDNRQGLTKHGSDIDAAFAERMDSDLDVFSAYLLGVGQTPGVYSGTGSDVFGSPVDEGSSNVEVGRFDAIVLTDTQTATP